jgi:flagellar motor protein MotB
MEASVYSEAKGEYTKQLQLFIVPAFHRFFMDLLQQASTEEPQAKRQLWKFQELLSQIPEWNIDKVQRETSKIVQDIHCDYLEELLTAVFIAHTKVLTAIRVGNKNKRVQITIPKLDHFLHRALSESSRLLWSSAYLFHNEMSAIDKQKNHRQIEQLLQDGIAQAIRGLLPVKNILKDYLAEPESEHEADDEDDEEEEHKKEDKHATEPVHEEVNTEKIEEHTPIEKVEEHVPIEKVEEHAPIEKVEEHTPIEKVEEEVKIPDQNLHIEIQEKLEEHPIVNSQPIETIAMTNIDPDVVQEPVATRKAAELPTIVVETEPSVRFTDYDQVIQKRGEKTHIDYVEKNRSLSEEDDQFIFANDDTEPLSDFEDLLEEHGEVLDDDDFETL